MGLIRLIFGLFALLVTAGLFALLLIGGAAGYLMWARHLLA